MLRVFDGVFSNASTTRLCAYVKHRFREADGHTLFRRNDASNPIERAIDSFLTDLSDDAPLVEYWRRATWEHVPFHRDLDEMAPDGSYHHPRHGHVLYLDIGSLVLAPTTLVWRDVAEGGGVLATVPPVRGRVLRFNGSVLHGVPRPHDAWLLDHDGTAQRAGDSQQSRVKDFRRDVLLFNTWGEGVLGEATLELLHQPSDPGGDSAQPLLAPEPIAKWHEHMPHRLPSRPANAIQNHGHAIKSPPRLRLRAEVMGNCVRRGCDERNLHFSTTADASTAFAERMTAMMLPIDGGQETCFEGCRLSSACKAVLRGEGEETCRYVEGEVQCKYVGTAAELQLAEATAGYLGQQYAHRSRMQEEL